MMTQQQYNNQVFPFNYIILYHLINLFLFIRYMKNTSYPPPQYSRDELKINDGNFKQGFNSNQDDIPQNNEIPYINPLQHRFGQLPNKNDQTDQQIPSNAQHQQEMMINKQLALDFGGMILNMTDSNFQKRNVPEKQESLWHIYAFLATLLLIPGIVVLILSLTNIIRSIIAGIVTMVVCYLLYLILILLFSQMGSYIRHLKKPQDYKQTFDKMVAGRGYFTFYIQCYHNRTTRSKNGGTTKTKVVTHTATQNFYLTQCFDESGKIQDINDINKYVFINYMRKFYFIDKRSSEILENAFQKFILKNKRDKCQDYYNTFNIENFEEFVGFTQRPGCHNLCLFIIFNMIGLVLPYAFIMERNISRYEINIVKRISCV